jgi:hypothetical protein
VIRIGCARRLLVCDVCYMLYDILLSVICYLLTILLICLLSIVAVINYGLVMMRWHRMMVYVAVEYESVCQL